MNWQLPLVVLLVAWAVYFVARQTWRTWSGRAGGCGKGRCGCDAPPAPDGAAAFIPADQLTLRSPSRGGKT